MKTNLVDSLRNVAIIAHVDHGKTTLVDAMIQQAGLLRENQEVLECMLDSNALERERGITIRSKNISVTFGDVKINLIDTPGHADFGGEVERVLRMADGALLLVDAFEGPMPQTRFVLRKALAAGLRIVLVVNKMDRAADRGAKTVDQVFDLMVELGATDAQLDFPVIYASGRAGWSRYEPGDANEDLVPLFETIRDRVPPPTDSSAGPFRMQVTSIDWSDYTGRIAIGRVDRGRIRENQAVCLIGPDGKPVPRRVKGLLVFEGMGRVETTSVEAGDLCAVVGLDDISIGDTIADPATPEALPRIAVEAPTVSMIFQVNDGPLAGKEGHFVTSRHLRDRLTREIQKNVALRIENTERPEALRVSGRGVLHLGILIEEMRREGHEFCVGKPQVILRTIDGQVQEPIETVTVEVPERHAGRVIELLGQRRGEMVRMNQAGDTMRLEYRCPSRGLIGMRTRILNLTQGEAVLNHVVAGYEVWKGDLPGRGLGSIISSEQGDSIHYALSNLKDRGTFFIAPGAIVYEGMVVGEHSKENDIEVNVCKAKKLSNVRASGSDRKLYLPTHRSVGVEEALEWIDEDELVEVTPKSVRLRKVLLKEPDRRRQRRSQRATT